MRTPRLVYRLYLFAAFGVALLAAALLVGYLAIFRPAATEYDQTLAWHAAGRLISQTEGTPPIRLPQELRSRIALYDVDGRMVTANTPDPPPLDLSLRAQVPASGVLAQGEGWLLRMPGVKGPYYAVVATPVPRFPPFILVPAFGAVLLLLGGVSFWYARRLAEPLMTLSRAVARFGEGDMKARARLDRDDEVGAVGRAFDEMADRITGLLAAQRALLADVSHELRTPLARIRVAVDVATEDPGSAKEMLGEVGADLGELERMIDDILTAGRLDVPEALPQTRRERFAADDLVARAEERFGERHPRLSLTKAVPGALPELEGDPMLLRRALDNLLDNAVKYGGAASPPELRAKSEPDSVVLEVVDHGPGLAAPDFENAFTPFWRADRSRTRDTGGVGLGLPLARRIARAHGGDLTLHPTPGGGLTARMRLPLAA
jgi:two-component system, OmpR family, sensor kinase